MRYGIKRLDPQLTAADVQTLKKLLVARDVLPIERKRYLALWHAHQGSVPDAVERLGLADAHTVRRAIHLYREHGLEALKERVHPGRFSALTPEVAQLLLARIQQDDQVWTTVTVADWLQQEHGVTLSRRAIGDQLLKLGLTWQRTRYVVAGRPDPQQQTEFLETVQEVKKGRSKG